MERVSYCDSTWDNGFEYHIQYYHKADQFRNRFVLPERTINNETSVNTSSQTNSVITLTELPQWELGFGAKAWMVDSKISYTVFPVLAYNKKIWFTNLTIEAKGGLQLLNGGISLNPELEAKLKVGL